MTLRELLKKLRKFLIMLATYSLNMAMINPTWLSQYLKDAVFLKLERLKI